MHGDFFELRTLPFEDRADAHFFYPTTECQEALAAMEYEIRHGTGLGLLIGEAGTGKTVLLRTLLRWLHKTDHTVVLTWPASGEIDLIRECCKGLGVTLPYTNNQPRYLDMLSRHLGRRAGAGNRAVLIVDQAENLSPGHIAQLSTLAELPGARGKLLTIILAAQPLLRALLDRPEFAWIRQQLFGERTLSPLTPKETGEYIRHRLQIAGAGDTRLFDDRAISLIHEISEGNPRLINRICHAAMMVASAAQTPRITRTIVEAASDRGESSLTSRSIVHERTIATRELGSAGVGEGGAPWMGVAVSPERMASSDESPKIPGPFGSSIASAAIVNQEVKDDERTDANDTSGASIVDGEYEGYDDESSGSTDVSLSHLAVVEQRLASLVDQAERLTTNAQTQTAQLERVCGAVRKVFTGLAEATLQAQRQTEELKGMSEDTATRLAKLTAETERATQTLHEWVEEAVRTQSRLERTLSDCPPIRQTHPTETVRRLSRSVDPFARNAAEAAGGQFQVLSEPGLDTTQIEPKIAKTPTRPEEIARLISEAKQQEAGLPA